MARRPVRTAFGQTLDDWRSRARRELGLDSERPIIATGHQTLLWHPGILAKFLVVEAFASRHDLGRANLIVDQHAEGFGRFDIPIRRFDGALGVRRIELCRPRKDVPMARHEPFTPPPLPQPLLGALPSVEIGARSIFDAVSAHRNATNAAMQMAQALEDLMKPWCRPMPGVCSSDLIRTSMARAMLREMARDPHRCADAYNRAVLSLPEVGIPTLSVRGDYVELPLWRIRPDGRRIRAYDNDVAQSIEGEAGQSKAQNPKSEIDLLPRALFMTALVRLCMCDLFIHGTGGANYDRAMERWIKDWLGIDVGSIAVVTANLRLPLGCDDSEVSNVDAATNEARWIWHDPEYRAGSFRPGPTKQALLGAIVAVPRDSAQRKAAFLEMHNRLADARQAHKPIIDRAQQRLEQAKRYAADCAIARRRDWAFPLYPPQMIDDLNQAAERCAGLASTSQAR